jgi:hypothetical protein
MRQVIGMLLALFGCVPHASAADASDYFGRWRVVAIADYAKVASVSDAKAKRKIGGNLAMSADVVAFDHRTCKPQYVLSTVDPEKDLEEGYRITNQTLKFPNPVVLIDTGCQRNRFIYVVNPKQLVIEQSGVFYRADRVDVSEGK